MKKIRGSHQLVLLGFLIVFLQIAHAEGGEPRSLNNGNSSLHVRCVVFRYPSGRDACVPAELPSKKAEAQQTGSSPGVNSIKAPGSKNPDASRAEDSEKPETSHCNEELPTDERSKEEDQEAYKENTANCLVGDAAQPKDCLEAGLGDHLRLKVDDLPGWIKSGKNPYDLILFLNERPMSELHPIAVSEKCSILLFKLTRDSAQKAAWDDLLGRATSFQNRHEDSWRERTVRASVGFKNQPAFITDAKFNLVMIHKAWLIGFFVFFGLLLAGLIIMGVFTGILRDSGDRTNLPTGKKPPYSLGRTQMAFWTFLVICGFSLTWMITGERSEIPGSLILLMGISSTTFVAAATVDSSKRSDALTSLPAAIADEATLAKDLAAATTAGDQTLIALKTAQHDVAKAKAAQLKGALYPKPSTWFLADILKDDNGYSLNRVQIAVWTFVLGVVFVKTVLDTLALPSFSNTLLGLLGVSAGTYVGFKFPEKS